MPFEPIIIQNLSYLLAQIYNKSLSTGLIPPSWKLSFVKPLFKGGIHSDPLQYRPINITPPSCKSLERVLVDDLNEYLTINNLLSDRQYGFRAGVSVSDQLLLTYNYVISAYDQGFAVDMIYFDYKKPSIKSITASF